MTALYRKNELRFSLIMIVAYMVLFSLADNLSANIGTLKLITAPLTLVMTLCIALWIRKNSLGEKYGLTRVKVEPRSYLYFLPLVVIASTNLWRGFTLRYSPLETALYVLSMLCVGFIEEVIFRGFLLKTLCRENEKRAIIIVSLTFGLGHIVNLLNGAELLGTLLQLCYAVALGFLFTVIVYRSGSLIPCIVTHSAINVLSAFGVEGTDGFDIAVAAILTVISLAYAWWIWQHTKPVPCEAAETCA